MVEELARLLLPPLTLHFFLTFPVDLNQRGWSRRLAPFLYLPATFLAALQWDLIANDGRYLLGSPNSAQMAGVLQRLDRAELSFFVSFAVIAGVVLLYRLLVGERREAVGAQPPAGPGRKGQATPAGAELQDPAPVPGLLRRRLAVGAKHPGTLLAQVLAEQRQIVIVVRIGGLGEYRPIGTVGRLELEAQHLMIKVGALPHVAHIQYGVIETFDAHRYSFSQ